MTEATFVGSDLFNRYLGIACHLLASNDMGQAWSEVPSEIVQARSRGRGGRQCGQQTGRD